MARKFLNFILVFSLFFCNIAYPNIVKADDTNPLTIYINGQNGNDANTGHSESLPVKSWDKAKQILRDNPGTIYVSGTVEASGLISTYDPKRQSVKRADNFAGIMFEVPSGATATFFNIDINGEDKMINAPIIKLNKSSNIYFLKDAVFHDIGYYDIEDIPDTIAGGIICSLAENVYILVDGAEFKDNNAKGTLFTPIGTDISNVNVIVKSVNFTNNKGFFYHNESSSRNNRLTIYNALFRNNIITSRFNDDDYSHRLGAIYVCDDGNIKIYDKDGMAISNNTRFDILRDNPNPYAVTFFSSETDSMVNTQIMLGGGSFNFQPIGEVYYGLKNNVSPSDINNATDLAKSVFENNSGIILDLNGVLKFGRPNNEQPPETPDIPEPEIETPDIPEPEIKKFINRTYHQMLENVDLPFTYTLNIYIPEDVSNLEYADIEDALPESVVLGGQTIPGKPNRGYWSKNSLVGDGSQQTDAKALLIDTMNNFTFRYEPGEHKLKIHINENGLKNNAGRWLQFEYDAIINEDFRDINRFVKSDDYDDFRENPSDVCSPLEGPCNGAVNTATYHYKPRNLDREYKISNKVTVMIPKSFSIKFQKMSKSREILPGATFVITNSLGKRITWISNSQDEYISVNLEPGEYSISEVQAPEGYTRIKSSLDFKVTDEGAVVFYQPARTIACDFLQPPVNQNYCVKYEDWLLKQMLGDTIEIYNEEIIPDDPVKKVENKDHHDLSKLGEVFNYTITQIIPQTHYTYSKLTVIDEVEDVLDIVGDPVVTIDGIEEPWCSVSKISNKITAECENSNFNQLAGKTVLLSFQAKVKPEIDEETILEKFGTLDIPNEASVSLGDKVTMKTNKVTTTPFFQQPEIEKYVEEAVHKGILLDEVFEYEILALVPKGTTELIITDNLVDELEFVSSSEQIGVAALDSNNHKATYDKAGEKINNDASVSLNGDPISDVQVEISELKKLTVRITPSIPEDIWDKWIKVSYSAKIDEYIKRDLLEGVITIDQLPFVTVEGNKVFKSSHSIFSGVDKYRLEPNVGNAPVKSAATHTGIENTASYVVLVDGDLISKDESNTVTVLPVLPEITSTRAKLNDEVATLTEPVTFELNEENSSVILSDIVDFVNLNPLKTYTIRSTVYKDGVQCLQNTSVIKNKTDGSEVVTFARSISGPGTYDIMTELFVGDYPNNTIPSDKLPISIHNDEFDIISERAIITKKEPVPYVITVHKTLENANINDTSYNGLFEFQLYENDVLLQTIPNTGSLASFDEIQVLPGQSRTFKIIEVEGTDHRFKYDGTIYNITVSANEAGEITTLVNGKQNSEIVFENTYIPEPPKIEKYVNRKVHDNLEYCDSPFRYTILTYIPEDATDVTITDTLYPSLVFVENNGRVIQRGGIVALKDNNHIGNGEGTVKTYENDSENRISVLDAVAANARQDTTLTISGQTITLNLSEEFLSNFRSTTPYFTNSDLDNKDFWLLLTFEAKYDPQFCRYSLDRITDSKNGWLYDSDIKYDANQKLGYIRENSDVRFNSTNSLYVLKIDGLYYKSSMVSRNGDVATSWQKLQADDPLIGTFSTLPNASKLVIAGNLDPFGVPANGYVLNGDPVHSGTGNTSKLEIEGGHNPGDYFSNKVTVEPPTIRLQATKQWKDKSGADVPWPEDVPSVTINVLDGTNIVGTINLSSSKPTGTIELPKLSTEYILKEVPIPGYKTTKVGEGTFVNTKYETPIAEKYVNKDVTANFENFDQTFTFDIMGFIPPNATYVEFTDNLNRVLDFVDDVDIVVEVLTENDHYPKGSVLDTGVTVKPTKATARDKKLTVVFDENSVNQVLDKWVRITFNAKFDPSNYTTLLNILVKKENSKRNPKTAGDSEFWRNIEANGTVISQQEHDGVPNEAILKINTSNQGEFDLLSNIVTVEPEIVILEAKKVWKNAENEEVAWPPNAIVTFALMANGSELEAKPLSSADPEKITFTPQPRFSTVTYTVTEKSVEGVEASQEGNESVTNNVWTFTNKLEPDIPPKDENLFELTVTKVWNDHNNNDGIRPNPETITVTLTGSNGFSQTETFQGSYTFTDLEINDEHGNKIDYEITELSVNGYQTEVRKLSDTQYQIINSHEKEKKNITVKKQWSDDNNIEEIRPQSITVNLYALPDLDNPIKETILSEENNWEHTFEDLDVYKNGEIIQYEISEPSCSPYTTSIGQYENTTDDINVEITNSYSPEYVNIPFTKRWVDDSNKNNTRPESITIRLLANGVEIKNMTIEANEWTHTTEGPGGMPTIVEGKELVCSAESQQQAEEIATAYGIELVQFSDGIAVFHTDRDPQTVINYGIENNLTKLDINMTVPGYSTITTYDNWISRSFDHLPKYKAGEEITYEILEDSVDNYDSVVNNLSDSLEIVNTYNPGKTSYSVSKAWSDDNNRDGIRPSSVKVQLLADGEPFGDPVDVTDTYTWHNLDLTKDGQEINYSATEINVPSGYSASYEYKHGLTEILNTHTPETVSFRVNKTWNDENNKYEERPETIQVVLIGSDSSKHPLELSGDFEGVFENLPKYANGVEIQYSLEELQVDGYEKTSSTLEDDTFNLVNSRIKKETEVTFSKIAINGTEEIPGATLEIFEGEEMIEQWISSKDKYEVELVPGEYRLVEHISPDNYAIAEDIIFRVNNDLTIEVKDGENWVAVGEVQMKDAPLEVEVEISKQDINGTDELEGAELIVTGKTFLGEDVKIEWLSGKTSKKITLLPGEYVLTEVTAPFGYKIAENINFTVDGKGKVISEFTVNGVIVMKDEVIEEPPVEEFDVLISKVVLGQGDELTGAELRVIGTGTDNSDFTLSWISEGTAKQLKLVPGTYTLIEDRAPLGYDIAESIDFEITEEGKILVNGSEVVKLVMEDKPTEVPDTPEEEFDVKISKIVLGQGKELQGAHLSVKGKTSKGDVIDLNWISSTDAKVIKLPAGKYTLTEDRAPLGYEIAESINFEVTDEGKLLVNGSEVIKLTMEDKQLEHTIKVSKINIAGEEIAGAKIQIKDLDGKAIHSWTSEKGKTHEFTLVAGDYIFHEEAAPNGYLAVTDIRFTVKLDGSISVHEVKGEVEIKNGVLIITDKTKPNTPDVPKEKDTQPSISNPLPTGFGTQTYIYLFGFLISLASILAFIYRRRASR